VVAFRQPPVLSSPRDDDGGPAEGMTIALPDHGTTSLGGRAVTRFLER
jgi:hypothetical protein